MFPSFRRELEKKKLDEPAKQILFAHFVPMFKKLKSVKVKSVFSPILRFHCNPGVKRIYVISQVMFPGLFALLNMIVISLKHLIQYLCWRRVINMILRLVPLMVKPHGMIKIMKHKPEISLCTTPVMIAHLNYFIASK
jgi:hypothetical protein